MPITGEGGSREIDLPALAKLVQTWRRLPGETLVGVEWPTTRPGEGAERSRRFGMQLGWIEAVLFMSRVPYQRIAPNLWKGRLGLPGKTDPKADQKGYNLLARFYPDRVEDLLLGPRGGLKSGRIDALCIAHWLRTRTAGGMRSVVETHGRGSDQAAILTLGGGRGRRLRGV